MTPAPDLVRPPDAVAGVPRLAYLDGLRGLAIAGVVATHVGQSVEGLPPAVAVASIWGLRGVHLFFIVSALTLMLVTRPDRFEPRAFWIRRFFRIAPMFYLAILFYTAMNWSGRMVSTAPMPDGIDVALTLAFLHGLNPGGINNVVPGGWSIGSEMIFYALFPLLVAVRGVAPAIGLALVALAAAGLALVVRAVLGTTLSGPAWADFLHFNFLMNAWPFALGILVHAVLVRYGDRRRVLRVARPLRWTTLALILAYGFVADRIPGAEIPFALLLAGLVLAVALRPEGLIVSRAAQWLGDISFSLYLIHFAVLFIVERVLPMVGQPVIDLILRYAATLAISALLATATYRLVEQPAIALGRRLSSGPGQGRGRANRPLPAGER